jgi:hypothetical protein
MRSARSTLAIERTFQFVLHSGVESVWLDGDMIRGEWYPDRRRSVQMDPNHTLLAEFANWSHNPKRIEVFTKKYGPLDAVFKKGTKFAFQLEDWKKSQKRFIKLWEDRRIFPGKRVSNEFWEEIETAVGEGFEVGKELCYRVSTLNRLLELSLLICPVWRLKKCPRPKCESPYFIAVRRSQAFCSQDCANEEQREHKRNWWNRHGKNNRVGRL